MWNSLGFELIKMKIVSEIFWDHGGHYLVGGDIGVSGVEGGGGEGGGGLVHNVNIYRKC